MKRHSNEKEGSKSRKHTIDELDMNRPSGQREEMGDVLLIQFSVPAQKQEAVRWETSVTFDCRLQTRGWKSGKAKALGWRVTSCFFGEEVTKGTATWGENQLEKLGWEQWHHDRHGRAALTSNHPHTAVHYPVRRPCWWPESRGVIHPTTLNHLCSPPQVNVFVNHQ